MEIQEKCSTELRAKLQRVEDTIRLLEETKKSGYARRDRHFEERGDRLDKLEAEVLAKRKRDACVSEVLIDLTEYRVPGSFEEVQRAEEWATILAKMCRVQAEAMRDDIVRRAQLTEDREAAAIDAPNEYMCPIGFALMVDPVIVAETCNTYERAKIEHWFATHKTDPNTNVVLTNKLLVPSINLRKLIQDRVALQSTERAAKHQRFESETSWVVEF